MAYQKRSTEEIKIEMESYNQKILDLGENFKRSPEIIADFLAFNANFYQYSSNNQMLIFDQNKNASFVGSYKHFKDQGYQVQKGEKGMKIFVPVKSSYFDRNGEKVPLKNATKQEKALIAQGEIEVISKLRFKLGTVFDIAQTDCPVENYPQVCSVGRDSEDHAKIYAILKEYCEDQGFPVNEKNLTSITLRGAFVPATNEIKINEKLKDTQKLGTFLHEMSHAFLDHNFENYHQIHDSMHEFEADGLAIMLLSRFGFEITEPMKAHLSNNFKSFQSDLASLDDNLKDDFSIKQSLSRINDVYKSNIDDIEQLIEDSFENEINNGYEMEM